MKPPGAGRHVSRHRPLESKAQHRLGKGQQEEANVRLNDEARRGTIVSRVGISNHILAAEWRPGRSSWHQHGVDIRAPPQTSGVFTGNDKGRKRA